MTQAIIIIFDLSDLEVNESLKTSVSLDALKGTCVSAPLFLASRALIHSFKARRLLLISAPSALLALSLLWVSCALSEPYLLIYYFTAKSTNVSFPYSSSDPSSFNII